MKPIYIPSGAAKEYGDLAINIYTGCPHNCFYCFAPKVLHRDRKEFHENVKPRTGIVEAVRAQLKREAYITDRLIHLCFVCDPYPTGYDSTPTRSIIRLIKESGNHVQILTKGDGSRDFDLLDENDWYGITLDGSTYKGIATLRAAHERGIKTWVSFEPVIKPRNVMFMLEFVALFVDKVKIGKLNYCTSKEIDKNFDWKAFGEKIEARCKELKLDYYIKDSIRKIMDAN